MREILQIEGLNFLIQQGIENSVLLGRLITLAFAILHSAPPIEES